MIRTGLRDGLPNQTPTWDSNARTHARTENLLTEADHLSAVDARRAYDGLATIGEVLEAGILRTSQRHEVIRTGYRQPIEPHVRSAVWYRDHGHCELCGNHARPEVWELDHIVPWSAGGSDDTTNLRVLCREHNQQRSNFTDPHERPRMPATWWCLNCYGGDIVGQWWTYLPGGIVYCPIHRSSKACPIVRNYRWLHLTDEYPPTWHERDPIEDTHATAFCAHCNAPGLTDRPL